MKRLRPFDEVEAEAADADGCVPTLYTVATA